MHRLAAASPAAISAGVSMAVDCGKQLALLAGVATRECRFGLSDSARVEADDVEMCDDFIRKLSEGNFVNALHTAPARAAGIHEQVAYPVVRRGGPVHIDRDSDASGSR